MVARILSSPGWPNFMWSLWAWIFCIAICFVVVFSWFLTTVPSRCIAVFPYGLDFLKSKERNRLHYCRIWWQYKSFSGFVCHFIVKTSLGGFFLSIRVSHFDVTLNLFWISWVTLNRFVCRTGMMAVFVNVMQYIVSSCFCQPCQFPRFFVVSVLLSL